MTSLAAQTRRWLEAGPPASDEPAQPFLLMTPLGLADEIVARTFVEAGVVPREVLALPDYPRASLALYARRPTRARVALGLAYEAAWRGLCRRAAGEVWRLDEEAFALAWQLKPAFRARWLPVEQGALRFRVFHLPDAVDVPRQWAWLRALAVPGTADAAICGA